MLMLIEILEIQIALEGSINCRTGVSRKMRLIVVRCRTDILKSLTVITGVFLLATNKPNVDMLVRIPKLEKAKITRNRTVSIISGYASV